ncbi:hypothetical protein Tco_1032109 [Tanacetum coccineum]|uniref:Uncharacterized protein n=1 Tax=Tanacetum coccineum TaxID=301880 RepID=A0ABQ5GAX4_9ASTR
MDVAAQLKIEKLVNEQPEFEVLIRSSHEAKSTHAVAANLSELELKKILIDKMKSNKSIDRSDEQKNLYKALVNAYAPDKDLLDAYGDTVTIKRRRDEADDDQEPSVGTDQGSKRRRAGKEPESSSAPKETTTKSTGKSTEGSKSRHQSAGQSALEKEPIHTEDNFEDPHIRSSKQESMTINLKMKSIHLLIGFRNPQEFLLLIVIGTRLYLLIMDQFNLVWSSWNISLKKYTITEQLNWTNPEGRQYPHDLRKPLPLISNTQVRQVIPFDHFINNDLVYLSGGVSSRKYATSVTKTKAADYGNIKWIEDLVPNSIWREVPVSYDKYALWKDSILQAGNPVKEILLKLNLPDHRTLKDGSEDSILQVGNPVKEILLKLNLPDHRHLKMNEDKEFQRSFHHSDTERLSRSDEVLKLKNFKKDATLKLFKSTNQERYEHVGPKVTSSQDGKVYKIAKRDYAWLMISRCSRSHIHVKSKLKEQA